MALVLARDAVIRSFVDCFGMYRSGSTNSLALAMATYIVQTRTTFSYLYMHSDDDGDY
jgi:hypothetical protein